MGECIGFNKRFEDWRKLEKNYVNHGFRTVSLDDFIKLGGYGKSIDGLIGEKLGQDEEPIFHAEIYNEEYFGKVEPVIDINELMIPNGGIQRGQYRLPSTE
ncbi:hypothetical protein GQ472_02295 [archaeon]|nr:hypothetical protein [archaeon]